MLTSLPRPLPPSPTESIGSPTSRARSRCSSSSSRLRWEVPDDSQLKPLVRGVLYCLAVVHTACADSFCILRMWNSNPVLVAATVIPSRFGVECSILSILVIIQRLIMTDFVTKRLGMLVGMFLAVASFSLASCALAGGNLYVTSTGSDSNPCTQAAPCRNIARASNVATPGTIIHVAPGNYAGCIV